MPEFFSLHTAVVTTLQEQLCHSKALMGPAGYSVGFSSYLTSERFFSLLQKHENIILSVPLEIYGESYKYQCIN